MISYFGKGPFCGRHLEKGTIKKKIQGWIALNE